MTDGGTYALVLSVPEPLRLAIGALGEHRLGEGGYAYVGSALGPGGFARVDRHRRVAGGDHDARHWHVDHLTGHPKTALVGVERVAGENRECAVADGLRRRGEVPVTGFGASDCDCPAHLVRFQDVATARRRASEACAARR